MIHVIDYIISLVLLTVVVLRLRCSHQLQVGVTVTQWMISPHQPSPARCNVQGVMQMMLQVLACVVTGWPPARLCLYFRCNREFGAYDLKVCLACHQYFHGREFRVYGSKDVLLHSSLFFCMRSALWYKYKRVESESRRARIKPRLHQI